MGYLAAVEVRRRWRDAHCGIRGVTGVDSWSNAAPYRGEGSSVVFVHGTSQDLRTWLHQVDAVSAEYRTIVRQFASGTFALTSSVVIIAM